MVRLLSSLAFAVCLGSPAFAKNPIKNQLNGPVKTVASADVGLRNGNFILAPIPFSNDTIGNGLALGAGYLFSLPGSKPSGIGVGYFETDTGSYAYGLGGSVVFDNDRWSLGAFVAEGELNYDLPIVGALALPVTQSVSGAVIRLDYGFSKTFKAGLGLAYLESNIAWNPSITLPGFLRPDMDVELARLTFDMVHDTRDDTFYPHTGTYAALDLSYGHIQDSVFGGRLTFSDRSYTKMVAEASVFRPIGATGVIAFNAVLCGAGSAAPFFDTCGVGFADGLRGFSALSQLADWSASAQVEYRGRFNQRLGYVVFAGAGAGGNDLTSLSLNLGGSAIGAGLRYRLSKKFGLDYAIDYARNNHGDEFLYLSVGQKF
ncbi:BamA/TamA family outer membrane protein [Shimia aestuarii]|uniref:Surface antigen n=1 Tax=Shimia aestuarii TaxID=254406 RepID=A0A1I4SJX0_9RHOB|nr:BamA/TamA family outer membrane protein [Shimia aestuarii]SFM64563.1 Surface antigen [Shimia aestuarii]